MIKMKIRGTGMSVPEGIVTNDDLARIVDTNSEWIESTLGIKERRIAEPDEYTSKFAISAAKMALSNAQVSASELDLIIVATATPDRLAPSTACIVQGGIGATNAAAFDISAVCSGFLYAFHVVSGMIQSGLVNNALIIGADTFSKITDWSRRDAVFFGDGAGAVVVSKSSESCGVLASKIAADGTGKDGFTVLGGGSELPASLDTVKSDVHYFKMNGRAVFNTATSVLPKVIGEVLNEANLGIEDIDLMIPHQPSKGILLKTAEKIGLRESKLMMNMDKYANTSGATIPILLHEVNEKGLIREGDILLLAAVGSGWTYGSLIFKW